MRERKRPVWLLFAAVFSVTGIAWMINAFTPYRPQYIASFFLLFFTAVFSLVRFFLVRTRVALLVSLGCTGFLLLRYLHLREPVYVVLLLASLVSLELALVKR